MAMRGVRWWVVSLGVCGACSVHTQVDPRPEFASASERTGSTCGADLCVGDYAIENVVWPQVDSPSEIAIGGVGVHFARDWALTARARSAKYGDAEIRCAGDTSVGDHPEEPHAIECRITHAAEASSMLFRVDSVDHRARQLSGEAAHADGSATTVKPVRLRGASAQGVRGYEVANGDTQVALLDVTRVDKPRSWIGKDLGEAHYRRTALTVSTTYLVFRLLDSHGVLD
jgi:hypothetical protein